MKVLGINGSPRVGGNTDILLDRALDGARESGAETEKIILSDLKFSPCLECDNLSDDGSCIINDDMKVVYEKVKAADALILASPIFFGTLSAQTKMMIDRFQCAWRAKNKLNKDIFNKKKTGAVICVAASDRKDFFGNAKAIAANLFATLNVFCAGELFCAGAENKGDILKRRDCLERARRLGGNLAVKRAGG